MHPLQKSMLEVFRYFLDIWTIIEIMDLCHLAEPPYMIMCHVSRDRSFLTLPSLGVDSTFLRYSLNRYLSTNSDNVIKGGVQLLRHAI